MSASPRVSERRAAWPGALAHAVVAERRIAMRAAWPGALAHAVVAGRRIAMRAAWPGALAHAVVAGRRIAMRSAWPGVLAHAVVAGRRIAMRAAWPGALALAVVAFGCGGPGSRAAAPASSTPASIALPPPLGALAPLVPTGARAVFVVRPSAVAASSAFVRLLEAVLLPGALDRFAARTGVDLRTLSEAVYADFGESGALWLARGPINAPAVVREAGARMSIIESQSDAPFVRRAGFFTGGRREVIALAPDVLVVTEGPAIQPLATLLACAGSRTRRCPSAFSGRDAAALLADLRDAPLVVHAPTGLELPEEAGLATLLAGTRAVALAVVDAPPGAGRLALRAVLRGRFPEGVAANFRVWLGGVGASELGAALGVDDAASRLEVTTVDEALHLDTGVDVERLARGLRLLFSAELDELLERDGTPPASPRPLARPKPGEVSGVEGSVRPDGGRRHAVALRAASARACEI